MTRRDDTPDESGGAQIEEWTPVNVGIRQHDERCMVVFKWGRWAFWYALPLLMAVEQKISAGGDPSDITWADIPTPIECPEVPACPPCPPVSLVCPPWPDGEVPIPLSSETPR